MLRAVKRELKSTWSVEEAITVQKSRTWVSCLALLHFIPWLWDLRQAAHCGSVFLVSKMMAFNFMTSNIISNCKNSVSKLFLFQESGISFSLLHIFNFS